MPTRKPCEDFTPCRTGLRFRMLRTLKKAARSQSNTSRNLIPCAPSWQKCRCRSTPDVQPQKFQDDLRTAVNRIAEKAGAAGVELPKGFYLGFSQYANSLPNEHAAPALAQQLGIIEKMITNLIDFKVQSIDSLNRLPLPEESAPPPRKTEDPQQRGGIQASQGSEAPPLRSGLHRGARQIAGRLQFLARFRSVPYRSQSCLSKYGARRVRRFPAKSSSRGRSPGSAGATSRRREQLARDARPPPAN